MLFKNQNTGEEVNVSNLTLKNDRIFFSVRGKGCGARFLNRNTCLVLDEHVNDGTYLKTAEGWEVIKKKKSSGEHKNQSKENEKKIEPKNEKKEEPKEEKKMQKSEQKNEGKTSDEQALINAIKNLRGGALDAAKVEEIVCSVIERMAKDEPKKVAKVIKNSRKNSKDEVYCENYDRIKRDLEDGYHVYLFGPAGCGKSHTAEQVANGLGLDFYGQTTIQFAHDVKGYGDAGGNYQETPFFKAFSGGGLYFQDEYDRSFPEAAIALNSALANGWFDFPVVGRVYAHPEFRFMAAGNTQMTGADEQYTTGQVMDASNIDRFCCMYEVGYSHAVEMKIAKGNKDLVQFIEDVRKAISECGIKHVVSYRATAYLVNREDDMEFAVKNCVFKTLSVDEIRMICNKLRHPENVWAKAANKAF